MHLYSFFGSGIHHLWDFPLCLVSKHQNPFNNNVRAGEKSGDAKIDWHLWINFYWVACLAARTLIPFKSSSINNWKVHMFSVDMDRESAAEMMRKTEQRCTTCDMAQMVRRGGNGGLPSSVPQTHNSNTPLLHWHDDCFTDISISWLHSFAAI